MPLSNSLTPGATFPLEHRYREHIVFSTPQKLYTALEFAPGTLTIAPAGSPYVSGRVCPPEALLADRTLIKIFRRWIQCEYSSFYRGHDDRAGRPDYCELGRGRCKDMQRDSR